MAASHQELSAAMKAVLTEARTHPDRVAGIVMGAYLDALLEYALERVSADASTRDAIVTANFGRKIELAADYALLPKHELGDLNLIRKIRNRAAHWWEPFAFDQPKVRAWCGSLHSKAAAGPVPSDPRERFHRAAEYLCFHLLLIELDLARRSRVEIVRVWPPEEGAE